jgi:hypothetical protein
MNNQREADTLLLNKHEALVRAGLNSHLVIWSHREKLFVSCFPARLTSSPYAQTQPPLSDGLLLAWPSFFSPLSAFFFISFLYLCF